MEILWLIIIGAIVGFLAQLVSGRAVHWLLSIVIGIVGVFLGFYIWNALSSDGPVIMGYVIGVIVAAIIVILVGRMSGSNSGTRT